MKELLRRHPKTTMIWAHTGLGRVVHPVQPQAAAGPPSAARATLEIVEEILEDPGLAHVHFDISWDEVAKYLVGDARCARELGRALINRYPDRFLFGTDEVAPTDADGVPEGLPEVRAALEAALTESERAGAQGKLRAPLRRGPAQGARLGERSPLVVERAWPLGGFRRVCDITPPTAPVPHGTVWRASCTDPRGAGPLRCRSCW